MKKEDLDAFRELYSSVYENQINEVSFSDLIPRIPGVGMKPGEAERIYRQARAERATNQRAQLGVVKTNRGYVAKPGATSYDPQKSAEAIRLANRLNKETGLGKPKPAEAPKPAGSPPAPKPAGSPPAPKPAGSPPAPKPSGVVLARKNNVTGTLDKSTGKFTEKNWTDAETQRYQARAAQNAARSAASSGASKPATPAIGKLGNTAFERRTPTSAELRAAQKERASGASPEKALQAAQRKNLPTTGSSSAIPDLKSVSRDLARANTVANLNRAPAGSAAANSLAAKPATSAPTPAQIAGASQGIKPATQGTNSINNKKPKTPTPGTMTQSFEWPSAKTIKDIADAYASIYEAKKKDQDQDGDEDFADVMIARMMASGMSRAEAIAAVKNKEYNEEFELDEAAKRTAKKVRGAKPSDKEWQRGRSDAGKRISGDEDTGPRHYTLGRARGAAVDAPTPPGAKPKNTPKLAGWEKDDIQYRKANLKAGRTHKVGGEKGLPEEYEIYEIVASYLLENNFAETLNDANAIIENMSENWLEEIIEQSAIASRTAAVVDDQRRGSHGMAHDQRMTGDSIKKLKRYKGPRVTPGLPEA